MKVYRKDGIEFLEIKDYKQVGRFMEVATIECSIKSPYPISFQIGDYVIFDYNGLQYSLYEIPVVKKQARSGSYGEAFVYDLKFKADTEQLVLCPFLDIVENDNNIHFTSLPNFSTFENVYGIVSRIQANMDYLYPGKWSIRVAETDDEELQDILSDAREFSASKNSCFDSCKKIFDIWGVSYIHTFEDGVNTITFGKSAGVTSKFRYGKGQGLRALKKNVQNTNELCTRLYAYGSTRNLPARWYNDKGYIGESQYVPNLMLPPSLWHDNKPQGAYIDAVFEKNDGDVVLAEDRIGQYGLRIKSFYYDGSENREEIYPSIEKLTAKNIRDAKADIGDTEYIPSTTLYPDSDRMDYILEGSSISDNGVLEAASDKLYSEKINIPIEEMETLYRHSTIPMSNGDYNLFNTKRTWRICSFDISSVAKYRIDKIDNFIYLIKNDKYSTITTNYYIENPLGKRVLLYSVKCEPETLSKSLQMPQVVFSADNIGTYSIIVEYSIVWPDDTSGLRPITSSALGEGFIFSFWMPTTTLVISKGELILSTFFTVKIKQIGFDLNDVTASNGAIKTISFKSGMCGGRSFEISSCERSVDDDSWILTCRRSDDSEVSQRFPNKIFPISAGDQFVLVNINMPDLYVWTAMYRLYDAAYADLLHYSRPQYLIEPEVDKIQIAKSQQLLREGMYMPIEDDDLRFNEDVLIDSVTINNKGTELRTFEVTLRNDKSLNRLSKLSDRVSSLESSTTQSEQDSTRTPAKDEFTSENMYDVSQRLSLLEDVIGIDSNKDVFIKEKENGTPRNFYSFGEITAGGVGDGTGAGSGSGGASTLGELLNVDSSVDDTQSEDMVLTKQADATHWAMRRLADMVGLDTEALAEYLTTNKYAQESYVQEKINDLINGAPTTLDTLKEIADAIAENETIVAALNAAIGNKLDKSQVNELFTALLSNSTTPISITVGGVTKTISQEVLRKSLGLGTAAYKEEAHFATSEDLSETNTDVTEQAALIANLTSSLETANRLIATLQEKVAEFEDWGFRLGTLSDGSRVLITPHNFASEGEVTANGTEVNDEFEQRIVVLPEAEYERLVEEGNINETKVYYVY